MDLKDIYDKEGIAGLTSIADTVGCSAKYLYQCATERRCPSPAMARKLIAADSRLSFDDMYRQGAEK